MPTRWAEQDWEARFQSHIPSGTVSSWLVHVSGTLEDHASVLSSSGLFCLGAQVYAQKLCSGVQGCSLDCYWKSSLWGAAVCGSVPPSLRAT